MFFLNQFGISLITHEDNDTVEPPLENEPVKVQEKPKISPLGFEISNDHNAGTVLGTSVFVSVDGDAGDPSSTWADVEIDIDGDPSVTVNVMNDTWLSKSIYLDVGDSQEIVPKGAKSIDDDGDIILDMQGFMEVNGGWKYAVKLFDDTTSSDSHRFTGKMHWDGKNRSQLNVNGTWYDFKLPFTTSMPEGHYEFV